MKEDDNNDEMIKLESGLGVFENQNINIKLTQELFDRLISEFAFGLELSRLILIFCFFKFSLNV